MRPAGSGTASDAGSHPCKGCPSCVHLEKKRNFSLIVLLFLNIAVAHGSNDLVFESCSQNEDPKSCSLLLLGQLLQDQLNLSGFPSQFKEQDVITLSLKLFFNNEGLLKPDWSIIYDPKTPSHEVFESVLKTDMGKYFV